MAPPSRILILEGYDEHPYSSSPRSSSRSRKAAHHRTWCATKHGRKVTVVATDSAGDECSGETIFAATKKLAKSRAVAFFRQGSRSGGRVRTLSGAGGRAGLSAAQRRFAAAAKSCRVEVGSGGRNRSYLGCMKRKLTK